MATVTFIQPFDMTTLPNTLGGGTTIKSSVDEVDIADPQVGFSYFVLFNNFTTEGDLWIGTVTRVLIDNGDLLAAPNLEISGVSFDVTTDVRNVAGKLSQFVTDLLAGSDTLIGSAGHDVMLGHNGHDTLIGGAGFDWLLGGDGNDTLDGGLGADKLDGGLNNDTYVLANDTTDTITDTGGVDTITSTISRTLVNPSIENLTLLGTANISGAGNAAANVIIGNTGMNGLHGLANNDVLIGGVGKDTLVGGLGDDNFRFATTTHSLVAAPDVVNDFDDFGNDRIDVSALFGPAMVYRHNLAFTAAGQVRINDIAGADVLVEVNVGGTLAPDLAIRLSSTTLASMTATDFLL